MTTLKLSLSLCVVALGLPLAAQTYQKVLFPDGRNGTAGGVKFELQAPDSPKNPQAWQGPLFISSGSSTCQPDISQIRTVYQQNNRVTIVISFSGSSTYVSAFDTHTCKLQWPVIKAFTEGISIRGTRLQVLPACECPGDGKPCSCSAGTIYKLRAGRSPVLLTRESKAFNKATLGIAFSGSRDIASPPPVKLPQAWQP